MNHSEKLVHMANQIADFFRPYPHEEAVAGVHDHIKAFWTPIMRAELRDLCAGSGSTIDPLVREAVVRMSPAQSQTARPARAGALETGEGA